MKRLAAAAILVLAAAGCSRDAKLAELESPVPAAAPAWGQGIFGYNEPLSFSSGLGVRAVAKGRMVAVSVRNMSQQPVVIGPDQFRVVTEDSLYQFQRGRDELSGFGIRELPPGEFDVFTVGLGAIKDPVNYALVFNYPPAGVLSRVFIEPAGDFSIEPPVLEGEVGGKKY